MKFWAKVELKGEENASELVLAFFREFNPESSITIQGKEAKVEIIFDNKPPMETIQAVYRCHVEEFQYGKVLGEYMEGEIQQVEVETPQQTEEMVVEEETPQQTEEMVVEEEIPQQTEEIKKKRRRSVTKQVESTKVVSTETVNILQLEEMAKKATSFEHFVKLVGECLELGTKQEIFEYMVTVATEVENISWQEVENALKCKDIILVKYDKIWIGRKVSEKFKNHSIKTLSLLNAMRQYKDYPFAQEKFEEKATTEHAIEETVTAVEEEILTQVEEVTPKIRVKMECMPEILHFEETLGSVDKTQPIEDRIRYVLNSMGLEMKSTQEQNEIIEIANKAIRGGKTDLYIMLTEDDITVKARMTFSKFINNFVSEYDPNKKVKLINFLKELQKIVMNESETESFTDSTN